MPLKRRSGPMVFVILDGVGYGKVKSADAVAAAYKPNLDWLHENCPNVPLKAHGLSVGLPSDADMGNSEVGHNAIGCGRVFSQGSMLITNALESRSIYEGDAWKQSISRDTLHLIGLFSDGNVHSHLDHLKALITEASKTVKKIRLHLMFDGRDVGETSGMEFIVPFEQFLTEIRSSTGCDIKPASGGGRMFITMDRYQAEWPMVERGWNTHVHGEGRQFSSLQEAYETLRSETGKKDQDLPSFVIAENGVPVGKINDNDAVVLFNFRGDRAIEISQAFEDETFNHFERRRPKNLFYAGIMQYDGDLAIPKNYLVSPPQIDKVIGEYIAKAGVTTLAISETQKFGHVTYFFNGNRSGYINDKLEKYVEIQSDVISYDLKPWMKCGEITDYVVDAIKTKKYQHIRLNYPNGDMVGHTGVFEAVRVSIETLDICLGRLMEAIKEVDGVMLISADHGNADDMFEVDKSGNIKLEQGVQKVKTSHSLNAVPFIIYDPTYEKYQDYDLKLTEGLGISSIASTMLDFLGIDSPSEYDKTIISKK